MLLVCVVQLLARTLICWQPWFWLRHLQFEAWTHFPLWWLAIPFVPVPKSVSLGWLWTMVFVTVQVFTFTLTLNEIECAVNYVFLLIRPLIFPLITTTVDEHLFHLHSSGVRWFYQRRLWVGQWNRTKIMENVEYLLFTSFLPINNYKKTRK